MLHGFRYPLTSADIAAFCHPDESSPFHRPFRLAGTIAAANGFMVIRCHRGQWMDSDFPEASPETLQRLAGFQWEKVPAFPADRWFPLDEVETQIRQRAPGLSPWLGLRCNASPVWKVGDVPVRVTFLHLAARLPRAECAWERGTGPLWFRFSGGMGAIARDTKLVRWGREIFADREDWLTGETLKPSAAPKPIVRATPPPTFANWPPPDTSDA